MARRIKGHKAGLRRYVPKALGNRGALPEDRVVVWIEQPTERARRELMRGGLEMRLVVDKDGKPKLDAEGNPEIAMDGLDAVDWQGRAIERWVTKIENYEGAGGVAIACGADLLEHGEMDFINEIGAEVLAGVSLDEQEKKDFGGSSATSSPGTSPPDGTARAADETGSTTRDVAPSGEVPAPCPSA